MNKPILLLLALAAPVWADHTSASDIFTPTWLKGLCVVTGINSATPAVVTVVSTAQCDLHDGNLVWVNGVNNTGSSATYSNLNIGMDDAADLIGLARCVGSVTGTTFTLKAADCSTNLTNVGTYSVGGMVARGEWRTLKSLPIGSMFDGPSGYLAGCITSSASGGCYESGRLERTALDSVTSSPPDLSIKHRDPSATVLVNEALRCAATSYSGANAHCINAKAGLLNTYLMPTASCDTTATGCDWPDSSYDDATFEAYINSYVVALNLLFDSALLSDGDRDAITAYFTNDKSRRKGGHDYTASTFDFTTYKTASGTITTTDGSTAVVGSSTSFLSQVSVGDYIEDPFGAVYSLMFEVASVTDDTHLTLSAPIHTGGFGGSGHSYRIARPWNASTDIGFGGMSKVNGYTVLCGAPIPSTPACKSADWVPGAGGSYGAPGRNDPFHNHEQGRLIPIMLLNLSLAHWSPKARWMASDAMFMWYHKTQPGAILSFGGILAQSSGYHTVRMVGLASAALNAIQNSFTSPGDPLGDSSKWWKEMATWTLGGVMPGGTSIYFEMEGEGSFPSCCGGVAGAGLWYMLANPLDSFAGGVKQFLTDWGYYTAGVLDDSGDSSNTFGPGVHLAYLANQPRISASRFSSSIFANYAPLFDGCLSVWTSNECVPDRRFNFIARSGDSATNVWNGSGSTLFYDMTSIATRDHAAQCCQVGPQIVINGHMMMNGDGYRGLAPSKAKANSWVLGSESNQKTGSTDLGSAGIAVSVPIVAYASDTAGVEIVNITDHYKSSANVTAAHRSVFFGRKSASSFGVYLFVDSFTSSGSLIASLYQHFWNGLSIGDGASGCGTLSASTCLTFDSTAKTMASVKDSTLDARLNVKWLDGTVATEAASDTNFAYTGGAGNTGRIVNALSSGTSGTAMTVSMPSSDKTATMPTITRTTSGNYSAVQWDDSTNPVVFCVALPLSSISETSGTCGTTHTAAALYVISGVSPGTYEVARNGSPVTGCTAVVVAATPPGGVLECNGSGSGVSSGTITFTQTSSAPAIDQSSLPSGTIGVAYSQTLTATGGAGSNSWDISSGALCGGLSMSSGGAITGTPTTAETCSFTARVTDSAMATDTQALSILVAASGGAASGGLSGQARVSGKARVN